MATGPAMQPKPKGGIGRLVAPDQIPQVTPHQGFSRCQRRVEA